MSQEPNVQLVERFFEMLARRDVDGWLDCFHPSVEFFLPRNVIEGGSYRGLDGVRRAWADLFEAWDDYRYEQADVRGLDDRVVSLGRATNVGKGGGPSVEYEAAYIADVEDGKITRWRPFLSHQEALKAVGLAE
jgi:ketosteroid isomerase-like protein